MDVFRRILLKEVLGILRRWLRSRMDCLMDIGVQMLMWFCLFRFSPLTFSTQLLPLRPASTSLRYEISFLLLEYELWVCSWASGLTCHRTLYLLPDPSSWMSSAPAASPSPPSSRTHKPSSSVPAAQLFSANQLVERLDWLRAARSAESRHVFLVFFPYGSLRLCIHVIMREFRRLGSPFSCSTAHIWRIEDGHRPKILEQ